MRKVALLSAAVAATLLPLQGVKSQAPETPPPAGVAPPSPPPAPVVPVAPGSAGTAVGDTASPGGASPSPLVAPPVLPPPALAPEPLPPAQPLDVPAVGTPTPAATDVAAAGSAPTPIESETTKSETAKSETTKEEPKKQTPWYERLNVRGYTQFRYNRIPGIKRNDELVNAQGDRYIGKNNGFGIRRARVILFGDVHERVSVYLQTDFASIVGGTYHVANVRDWYADLFFDKGKTLRLRVGQSKVPYGFENLQSSQNRLALDRNDALNSTVKDERDIGMFLYWAPKHIRERFKHLVDANLKGSGDYGALGIGVYNGQTANQPALGDHMHVIGRVSWPFKFGEQFVELGGGGYTGKYRTSFDPKVDAARGFSVEETDILDARGHISVIVYPQPFGFQAEATYGTGPSLGSKETQRIESRRLYGGYAQLMYKIDEPLGTVSLIPYARGTYYEGGKKFETLAPKHLVKELEIGLEWQLLKALEVVLAYDMAHRKVQQSDKLYDEKGHIGRVQLQVNY